MCVLTEDRVRAAIKAAALTRRRRHDREARERPCRICFAYYYKPPFPEASLTLSLSLTHIITTLSTPLLSGVSLTRTSTTHITHSNIAMSQTLKNTHSKSGGARQVKELLLCKQQIAREVGRVGKHARHRRGWNAKPICQTIPHCLPRRRRKEPAAADVDTAC